MTPSISSRTAIALLLVFLLALHIALSSALSNSNESRSVLTRSSYGAGLSATSIILASSQQNIPFRRLTPILDLQSITPYRTIALLAPQFSPSSRKIDILKLFAKRGGLVFVTLHDRSSVAATQSLLRALKISTPVVPINQFANRTPLTVSASPSPRFLPTGTYSFYGLFAFDTKSCRTQQEWECFVIEKQLGRGGFVFLASLPPFSNGLVSNNDNSQILFHLVHHRSPILIDEYRHYLSDVSITDVLTDLPVMLPLLGIFGSAILFFSFAHSPFHEKTRLLNTAPDPVSFHERYSAFIEGVLSRSQDPNEVLAFHRQLLNSLRTTPIVGSSPEERTAMQPQELHSRDLLSEGHALIRAHASSLRKQGMSL